MNSYIFKATSFLSAITLLTIVYSSFRDVINTKAIISRSRVVLNAGIIDKSMPEDEILFSKENKRTTQIKLKYILQWTSDKNVPFVYMGKGRSGFVDRKCPHTNCFVTSNKSLLGDYTMFDVIAFAGPELFQPFIYHINIPRKRSPHQKYVFASIESSAYYPACTDKYDGFFNWTWTYRLDSEVRWGYIVIRDLQNSIIGPGTNINWLKKNEMTPVSEEFKIQLRSKKKAAAWFVSNCRTQSRRERLARRLQIELFKYNQEIDIYGDCGHLRCSRDNERDCDKKIAAVYYFYLSFENAFTEDYVTEKLLHALKNNAVPIVYGGANYSRFLPEGSYLDAVKLGVVKLAAKMNELINDPKQYADFFRWKNHYTYHQVSENVLTNEYCRMCAILNDDSAVNVVSVYKNFSEWWDPPEACASRI